MSSCSSLFYFCSCCQTDDDISLHQKAQRHGNNDKNHSSHHDQNQHYDQEAKAWGCSTDLAHVLIISIHHKDGESASKLEEQCKNNLDVVAKAIPWEGHSHVAINNKPQAKKKGTKSCQPSTDPFSDYIHRAKMKIRSLTLCGGKNAYKANDVHNTQKENHSKDTFSEYIDHTKMKIRKKSSIGIRNSPSKKE